MIYDNQKALLNPMFAPKISKESNKQGSALIVDPSESASKTMIKLWNEAVRCVIERLKSDHCTGF